MPVRRLQQDASTAALNTVTAEVEAAMPAAPNETRAMSRIRFSTRLTQATSVGMRGPWRLKKARVSSSARPLNTSPIENATSVQLTCMVAAR